MKIKIYLIKIKSMKKETLAVGDESKNLSLITATKLRWKQMRTIMNPTFSSHKLREVRIYFSHNIHSYFLKK